MIYLFSILTYKTKYKRRNKTSKTSFNNEFFEGMNNKIKLIKSNAHSFKHFFNLRGHIFYILVIVTPLYTKTKKGIPIFNSYPFILHS